MKNILISFVIPAYNAELYIERCLKKICQITSFGYEIIVIDDGSKDDTRYICERYVDKGVRIFSVANSGVSNARNIGIQNAKGKYIAFVDADDYIEEVNYEKIALKIKNETQILMYSYLYTTNSKSKEILPPFSSGIYGKDESRQLINMLIDVKLFKSDNSNIVGGHVWKYIFGTDFIKQNSIKFDVDIAYAEDLCFCIAALKQCSFLQIERIAGYNYIATEGTASRKYRSDFWENMKKVYKNISDILGVKQYYLLYYYGKGSMLHYVMNCENKRILYQKVEEIIADPQFTEAVKKCESYKKTFFERKEEQWYLQRSVNALVAYYHIKTAPICLLKLLGRVRRYLSGKTNIY